LTKFLLLNSHETLYGSLRTYRFRIFRNFTLLTAESSKRYVDQTRSTTNLRTFNVAISQQATSYNT